jgi:hypothetical protein
MSLARLLMTTAAFGLIPLTAWSQATSVPGTDATAQPAPPAQAASAAPMTQNVTVAEPDTAALKPPPPPAMTMPRWSEFPVAPANVPTVADFAQRVHAEEAARATLDAIGRTIVWEIFEPAAIVAAANAQIDPSKLGPIDAEMTAQQSDALAQSLRYKATAPPVAQ